MDQVQTKKTHSDAELEQLYSDAESVDSKCFSEMRSNVLLVSGEHYNRRNSEFYKRIRSSQDLSDQQKIRLTKNHIQKISKTYQNNIISMAPGVGFKARNENELQDQKSAELHHAVWRDAMEKYDIEEKIDSWVQDYVDLAEIHVKIIWNPNGGKLKGYNQAIGEDGVPLVHPDGSLAPDMNSPIYYGEFIWEDIPGYNLLRAPDVKTLKESPYLIVRKMVQVEELKDTFPDHKDKIKVSQDKTFKIFDGGTGDYKKGTTEVLVKEFYFRPCGKYKNGYFYIKTEEVKLAEGELPGGHFPIVSQLFDKAQSTARGRSIIKVARPYQIEINRSASKIAEHQITLGDDKLVLGTGLKASAGISLPGVRTVHAGGSNFTVIPGRDGSQYSKHQQDEIAEMYSVLNVSEDSEPQGGQMDPFAMLFRAAYQKKRFQLYVKRFERFLIKVCKLYLNLAKIHLPDDVVIQAIGRSEAINVSEFKNASDLCYQIEVTAQSEDVESKMGKHITLSHALQYASNKMEKEDIGKMMRTMPYGNFDESFKDMTLDYDSATNDILALDRGEAVPVNQFDNHAYIIKRLVARMRQADFKMLAPEIQKNYQMTLSQHEELQTMELIKIQRAQQGFIPTDGYLVKCDFYVPDAKDPTKTKRAALPQRALEWLIQHLEAQGQGLDKLEDMNQGAMSQMADMYSSQLGMGANGMAPMSGGNEMPQGAINGNPYSAISGAYS